jgi:hypothetical protein
MATIEINDGDSVQVIELQVPFYGVAGSELEFGARAEGAVTKGDVVFVSGATGTHIQVQKAQANAEATSAGSIGVAKNTAANNQDLQVVTFGVISNLNTSAYTEGQVLYLSAATAGAWVTSLPVAPNHGVRVGWVVRSHPSQGALFVDVQNYQELEELSDVNVAGVTDGQVLTYQSSSGTWIPGTPNPGDITAVNVTSPITGGGTSGSVTVGLDQTALSLTASQISDGSTTWARLAAANTFTVGNNIIVNHAAAATPLRLRGFSGQTANLFEVQNSTPTTIAAISASGTGIFHSLQVGSASFAGASWNGISNPTGATTLPTLIIRGIASQSANLQEWQDSSGNILTQIAANGNITTQSILATGVFRLNNAGGLGATAHIVNSSASNIGLILRGAASQTADLTQWQISDGTVRSVVDKNGFIVAGGSSALGNITSFAFGATQIPIVARGAASQTANLQEWQTSAGTANTRINSSGNILTAGLTGLSTRAWLYPSASTNEGFKISDLASASVIPLIVQGAASQTGLLTDWRDSTGSTIAYVGPSGAFVSTAGITANNGITVINSANSGSQIAMAKQTAAAPNPGANTGRLYFRDGTNAGTLKLVVRAGAAGAETTILDNIPQ